MTNETAVAAPETVAAQIAADADAGPATEIVEAPQLPPGGDGAIPDAEADRLRSDWTQGRRAQAGARAMALAKLYPNASLPKNLLGMIAFANGAFDEAVDFFKAAADGAPETSSAIENLANAQARIGAHARAVAAFRRLAETYAGHPTPRNLRVEAECLLALGRPSEAVQCAMDGLDAGGEPAGLITTFRRIIAAHETLERTDALGRLTAAALTHPTQACARTRAFAEQFVRAAMGGALRDGGRFSYDALSDVDFEVLVAYLRNELIVSLDLEALMISVRSAMARAALHGAGQKPPARFIALAEALALQADLNEHIWDVSEADAAMAATLRERVEGRLARAEPVVAHELFILGAYQPLSAIPAIRQWVAALAAQSGGAVDATLQVLVLNRTQEEEIAPRIPTLTSIDDAVSSAVQAQYEENPYPRWRRLSATEPVHFLAALRNQMGRGAPKITTGPSKPKVLVAGCGTGQHPIHTARQVRGSSVIAIDLSRASLAYGVRQARAFGVHNVAFAHADILKLQGLDEEFDVVESVGVLHHMADPEAGLAAVTATLKRGGFLRLGLYSEAARQDVVAARAEIAERGVAPTLAGLRAYRREAVAAGADHPRGLARWRDFYAASELRDLIFHVQEHRFTLPQISAMLERHRLQFLGFAGFVDGEHDAYAAMFPGDASFADLTNWAALEAAQPDLFSGMYQFWCRKLG